MNQDTSLSEIWLPRFTKLLVLATLLLIFVGGMVTSTDSGLSVPDWPKTYGYNMFAFPLTSMVGGILYEHGHRLFAAVVGILTMILTVWVWVKEKRMWVKKLTLAALSVVILQGILGGITVLFYLPTAISVGHATLAQTFFCFTIFIAYSYSRENNLVIHQRQRQYDGLYKLIASGTVIIFIQLILGALMRHTDSGLAVLDFPLSGGAIIPTFSEKMLQFVNNQRDNLWMDSVTMGQMAVHSIHRIGAIAIIVITFLTFRYSFRNHRDNSDIMIPVWTVSVLVVIQVVLGAFTILSLKAPVITSLHVVTGASILGFSFWLLLRTNRLRGVLIYQTENTRSPQSVLI